MHLSLPHRAISMFAASAAVLLGAVVVPVVAGSVMNATASSAAVAATPGTPGVPQPPVVVYSEDFQNRPGPAPIVQLNGYTGITGQGYIADPAWLRGCNGWIASAIESTTAAAPVADCGALNSWNGSQQLAQAIGLFHGQSAAVSATNYADTAFTAGDPGAGKVEFQTASNIPFAATDRFLGFSVDSAAVSCDSSAPQLQFYLLNSTGAASPVGGQVNACSNTTRETAPALGVNGAVIVNAGTATSKGSMLFSGSSVGLRLVNNNGSGAGNDGAIDNPTILDESPQLDKVFSPLSVPQAGISTLTFTVTNTTELAAKAGWSFTDALPAGLVVAAPSAASTTCSSGVVTAAAGGTSVAATGNLMAGQAFCTVSVNVTSPTVGSFTNNASNFTGPAGLVGLNPPGASTVTFTPAVDLAISKAVTPSPYLPDSPLTYTVTVTNAGPSTATNATVTDTLPASIAGFSHTCAASAGASCPTTGTGNINDQVTIPAGGNVSYTITGTAPAASTGTITNTAAVIPPTGTTDLGCPSAPGSGCSATVVAPVDSLLTTKSISSITDTNADSKNDTGDVIHYQIVTTNNGTAALTGVTPTDTLTAPAAPAVSLSCTPTSPASLAPNEAITCAGDYPITQADTDRGTVTNTATATGQDPNGATVVSPNSSTTTALAHTAALIMVKSSTTAAATAVGQVIPYQFLVTNTGDVTLTDVTITDVQTPPAGALTTGPTCPAGSVAPGDSVPCTATYTVTQADLDSGAVSDTATATATPPSGPAPVSPPSSVSIPVTSASMLTVAQSTTASKTALVAGEVIPYQFVVTNTGNVSLTDITVTDVRAAPAGALTSGPSCPAGTVAPGDSVTCTATYTVTQADVDHGTLSDTATATATPPSGPKLMSAPATMIITQTPAPALTVVQSTTASKTALAQGEMIRYQFVVTNTGNVTLTDVSITDVRTAPAGALTTGPTCPGGSVAPGDSVTCTATYTVTQADVDHGTLSDTATATATPPSGPKLMSAPATMIITQTPAPALTVVQSTTASKTALAQGEVIRYQFVVTNTGNVTLTDVSITDVRTAPAGALTTGPTCPGGSVAPGDSVTCTATYTVTQADVDHGTLSDTATATATPPSGPKLMSAPAAMIITQTPAPALTVVQSTTASKTALAQGEVIRYQFVVTNTGNVTLTDVSITDVRTVPAGALTSGPSCPAGPLAPRKSTTCTATYTVTQADVAHGTVTDSATATGTAPSGRRLVSLASTVTVPEKPQSVHSAPGAVPATPATLPSPSLPFTGNDTARQFLTGGFLLTTGAILLLIGRRRRRLTA